MKKELLLTAIAVAVVTAITLWPGTKSPDTANVLNPGEFVSSKQDSMVDAARKVEQTGASDASHSAYKDAAYQRTRNFADEVLQTQARAYAGEAAAQRQLAEIYGNCLALGQSPAAFLQGVAATARLHANRASARQMEIAAQQLVAECGQVDGGQAVPLEAQKLWLAQAAKGGDLTAKVRMAMYYPNEAAAFPVAAIVEQALMAADASALFDLGQVLNGRAGIALDERSAVLSGEQGGYALSNVACRRGLDCSGDSRVMRSVCLNTGACESASYEDFVRSHLVPIGEMEGLDRRVAAVAELVKSH